jgi:uncharacterized protein with NRDE domain
MCLIAFASNVHPSCPLVLIANRDEFHARPTAALGPWDGAPQIVGGRDLEAGGGWLAIDRQRPRLAAVTNVREVAPPPGLVGPFQSRGALVHDYLAGDDAAACVAEMRRVDGNDYGPFNLLLWDGEELIVATNRPKPRWETVGTGVHGLSNGSFEGPWPKTRRLIAGLSAWLALDAGRAARPDERTDLAPLYALLADEHRADDADLPDTGFGLERERLLAPAFIRLPGYGTRASQIVIIGRDGQRLFAERRYGAEGVLLGETRLVMGGG